MGPIVVPVPGQVDAAPTAGQPAPDVAVASVAPPARPGVDRTADPQVAARLVDPESGCPKLRRSVTPAELAVDRWGDRAADEVAADEVVADEVVAAGRVDSAAAAADQAVTADRIEAADQVAADQAVAADRIRAAQLGAATAGRGSVGQNRSGCSLGSPGRTASPRTVVLFHGPPARLLGEEVADSETSRPVGQRHSHDTT